MQKRTITAAGLSGLLALGTTAAVSGQDSEPVDDESAARTFTGTIVTEEKSGQTVYYLRVKDELIVLSFGPSWFYDLGGMFDSTLDGGDVVIGGNLREMSPNENASETAKAKAGKTLKVKTLAGQERPRGKPAWAGGPEEQGVGHPGHEGWSKGQANKTANQAPKPETSNQAPKPERPDTPGNGPKAPRSED